MKYQLNINLEPYSNVIMECDSETVSSDLYDAIRTGLIVCEMKRKIQADRERELLFNEIELLMQEKEYDSFGLCEYLEVPNLMRETLLKCDTQKLRFVIDGLKQKPNRKE